MRIVNPYSPRVCVRIRQTRWALNVLAVSGLALLQACAVNTPTCDGRFEPINLPAPVQVEEAEEKDLSEGNTQHERG